MWIKLTTKTVDEDPASRKRWISRKEIKGFKPSATHPYPNIGPLPPPTPHAPQPRHGDEAAPPPGNITKQVARFYCPI